MLQQGERRSSPACMIIASGVQVGGGQIDEYWNNLILGIIGNTIDPYWAVPFRDADSANSQSTFFGDGSEALPSAPKLLLNSVSKYWQ